MICIYTVLFIGVPVEFHLFANRMNLLNTSCSRKLFIVADNINTKRKRERQTLAAYRSRSMVSKDYETKMLQTINKPGTSISQTRLLAFPSAYRSNSRLLLVLRLE